MVGGGGGTLSHAALLMERSTAKTGSILSQGWILQLSSGIDQHGSDWIKETRGRSCSC